LTIIVMIDSPQGGVYYGGAVAAPVFKRVAEQALRYLGVAPTVSPAPPVLMAPNPLAAPAGRMLPVVTMAGDPAVEVATGPPVVPDLHGLSARDAILRLARLGLVARVSGDGVVVEQHPAAGTPLDQRGTCTLRLERVAQVPAPSTTPQ
jgi:cell division protein FtsI (penicillin-binding protein 3)